MAGATRQEWINVSRSKAGETVARVTLMEGNRVARWSVKTYTGHINKAVVEARAGAEKALGEVA